MEKPILFLPLREIKKIWAWISSVPGEINGLGLIDTAENDFRLVEAFLLKQKVTQTSAITDPMAFNAYVGECEDPSKIAFQWHSHGEMPAFFSDTDMQKTINRWTGEYLISLVLNKQGEYRCRLDIFEPIRLGLEIPVYVMVPIEKAVIDFCQKEIAEKVQISDYLGRLRKRKLPNNYKCFALPLEIFRLPSEEEENG